MFNRIYGFLLLINLILLAPFSTASAALTFGANTISTDGAYTLNGVASSTYLFGTSTTTGTITIGGTAQTGNIVLGSSTQANSLLIGNGTGVTTITMATGNTNSRVGIGNSSPQALLHIGTAGSLSGTIKLDGSTSGTVTVKPAAAAGTWTLTLPSTTGTSGQFLQTNGSGTTTWADSRPYRIYVALLNQSGTSAPVATVLENTLGGTISWAYNGVGSYNGTLTGATFTDDKTVAFIGTGSGATDYALMSIYRSNGDPHVSIDTQDLNQFGNTASAANSMLSNTPIEIRVYP